MPTVPIGDAEIYCESAGDGPPLMIVSGLGGLAAFWTAQVEAFAPHFRVLTHDHRGTGRSTHSRIRYSVDGMAADTLAIMDALGIARAHFLGHSTGGAIGLTIAASRPERLASLVLSATWAGPDPYFRRCFESRREVLAGLGVEAYVRASNLTLYPPAWIRDNGAALDAGGAVRWGSAAEIIAGRIDAILAFDRRADLAGIACPTLVICAEDDLVCPPWLSDEIAAAIPGARRARLPQGGHFAPITETAAYNAAVLEFLASLPPP